LISDDGGGKSRRPTVAGAAEFVTSSRVRRDFDLTRRPTIQPSVVDEIASHRARRPPRLRRAAATAASAAGRQLFPAVPLPPPPPARSPRDISHMRTHISPCFLPSLQLALYKRPKCKK